ncbi:sensor histidine kinase [Halonotius sp. GCM10025705]|uniref:sensor histidine kinase n=1 Tax=Halonotius sp. GCM10025705 TaxID=3252678 RepID=UPI0036231F44
MRDVTERKEYEARLENQNERLEDFASVVSHDLRNPLNVAQGRLDLIMEDHESEHLDAIERSHNRMEALIEDLLTLARVGDAVSDLETVELSELASTCWANVETDTASMTIDTTQTILADTSRLKQVFENLMRNAIEHGGEDVAVTVGTLNDGFYIEDDGPGIPPNDRDEVFKSGYSTNPDGTGFGLHIIKQIIEVMTGLSS